MTPKQMYSELAKIAGASCASGDDFIRTANVTEAELRRAQRSILALLDKLNHRRSSSDFSMSGNMASLELEEADRQLARVAADRDAMLLREAATRARRRAAIDPFGDGTIAAPGAIGESYGSSFLTSYTVPRMVVRGDVARFAFDDPPTTMPGRPGEPMEP